MRVKHDHDDGKLVGWRELYVLHGKTPDDKFRDFMRETFSNRAIETGADAMHFTLDPLGQGRVEVGIVFAIPDGARVYVPAEVV